MRASLVQQRYGIGNDVRIGIGVERWDFTKGIIERFHALEHLFEDQPGWMGRLTFLQVAAPSRSKLPAYQALQEQTLAGSTAHQCALVTTRMAADRAGVRAPGTATGIHAVQGR